MAATSHMLRVGAAWRWSGQAVRVDGPKDLLLLDGAKGAADLRKRAAKAAHRLAGTALPAKRHDDADGGEETVLDNAFIVTDGRRSYTITLVQTPDGSAPLLMFLDEMPPVDTDLWIVQAALEERVLGARNDTRSGVICFAGGTRIATPDGPRPVEDLREGDWVQTKDDGAQEIRWIGQRQLTGARLFAMPQLRPIRIRSGALEDGEPEGDLLVSPEHRVLIKGKAAMALFNAPEVLVAARDLINDRNILVDHAVHEVTYFHLMLDRHQILWANGVQTESFHPAHMPLDMIEDSQRARLFDVWPELEDNPQNYGGYARRSLSLSEAEILKYDRVVHH